MVYKWKNFSYSVPAQKVGERIEKLEKTGDVTAERLVDDARPEKSVLHPLFEWDDREAAEKYRRHQAGMIIGNLVVTVETPDESGKIQEVEIRAYSNVNNKGFGNKGTAVFVNTQNAMQSAEQREVILNNALIELTAFENKYQTLTEFNGVFKEIDKLTQKRAKK